MSTPLFDRLLTRVRTAHPARDPLTTATALWAGVHGIARRPVHHRRAHPGRSRRGYRRTDPPDGAGRARMTPAAA
ncbi:hypothetical protein ABZV91_05840 [Nocardia sp. NPDC004568]|uniref:hypothetical protein n=1 Tax=Nocardia sp. NPDC004568 TaxID=3154551 RepID=UPI0033B8FBBD